VCLWPIIQKKGYNIGIPSMQVVKPIKITNTVQKDRTLCVLAIVGDTQVGDCGLCGVLPKTGSRSMPLSGPSTARQPTAVFLPALGLESGPSSTGFGDEMEKLARKLDVGSIMPVSEGYHNALIEIRGRFEPDIHLFSPSRECFDKATDKDYMQSLCVKLGISVAQGMRLDQLMADGKRNSLRLPLVLRTRRQNIDGQKAPWKAAYAETPEKLRKLYEQVKKYADNVIVQEYHPGVEDHLQILMHGGKVFGWGDYIGEHHMPLAGGVTVQAGKLQPQTAGP
jgi:hypothetical protein